MADRVAQFMELHKGLPTAFGTGKGSWVKEPPVRIHFERHLDGLGPGLGIAPLMNDGNVNFAAIDLDEPDFETARTMMELLPGPSFLERSRSGNAHIWVYFSSPCLAWVARGILREVTAAMGMPRIEVFPKQDTLKYLPLGNYINLSYFGDTRKIIGFYSKKTKHVEEEFNLSEFLDTAYHYRNDPQDWMKRAAWYGIPTPDERRAEGREFGTQSILHMCAEHVLAHRDDNPVVEGHRAIVYFALCKQFANCTQYDAEEAIALLCLISDASPDPVPEEEIRHMYENAVRGQYTSTGCDDPLFAPYAHPDCPIANGKT